MNIISEKLLGIYEAFYNAIVPERRYMAYVNGLKVTLIISLFAVLLGVVIGVVAAVIKVCAAHSKSPAIRIPGKLCDLYITVIRGTPLMVQLLIIYNLIFTSRNTNPILVGTVCFGINSGAYVAEIVRAGINAVDSGQMEAGRSLGFNWLKTMWYIVLPQAIKNILPALGNEFIVLVKETSVASVIAVNDLTKNAQYIGSRTWDLIPPLLIAAAIYLVIVVALSRLLRFFERRLAKGDRH